MTTLGGPRRSWKRGLFGMNLRSQRNCRSSGRGTRSPLGFKPGIPLACGTGQATVGPFIGPLLHFSPTTLFWSGAIVWLRKCGAADGHWVMHWSEGAGGEGESKGEGGEERGELWRGWGEEELLPACNRSKSRTARTVPRCSAPRLAELKGHRCLLVGQLGRESSSQANAKEYRKASLQVFVVFMVSLEVAVTKIEQKGTRRTKLYILFPLLRQRHHQQALNASKIYQILVVKKNEVVDGSIFPRGR